LMSVSMRIIVSFLLLLLVAEAVCAKQRMLDIRPGDSCDRVSDMEKQMGSHEFTSHDAKGIRKFNGIHGGEEATIVYLCEKGVVVEQKVIVMSATREVAYRFAEEQEAEFTKHLGEPIHDGLTLGIWERLLFGFKGADLDYITSVVLWGRAKEDIMLFIRETGASEWEVTISQGSSKMEYILNS